MRIAIIGAGRIAQKHIDAIGSNFSEFNAQLTAICDLDSSRLEGMKINPAVEWFSEIESMMVSSSPDLVAILTPSGLHSEHARRVLRYRKPVLVEKPLSLDISDASKLVTEYENARIPLFYVMQNRLNPAVVTAKSLITSGEIGEILYCSASMIWCRPAEYYLQDDWRLKRNMDGGVIWNQASHYVDLLNYFLGPFRSVYGVGRNFLSPAEAEDTIFATMTNAAGKIASLQATTTGRPENFEGQITVGGSKGIIRVGGHALNSFEMFGKPGCGDPLDTVRADVYGNGHQSLYREILSHLKYGTPTQFFASQALETIATMSMITRSVKTGLPVNAANVG